MQLLFLSFTFCSFIR